MTNRCTTNIMAEPQRVCRDCGAAVVNPAKHNEFHEVLLSALANILTAGKGLLALAKEDSRRQEGN